MKFLIILAVVTLARGIEVSKEDDAFLKELESLVTGKVANDQTNDESELEKLIQEMEKDDEPSVSEDEAVEAEMKEIDNDARIKARGPRPFYGKGDSGCRDSYSKCYKFTSACNNERHRYHKLVQRKCRFTCEVCYPSSCKDSKYGCCRNSNLRAEGFAYRGCNKKQCYDLYSLRFCREKKAKGLCEKRAVAEACPRTCGTCTKAPTEAKCANEHGYGCCENPKESRRSAIGPKAGCDKIEDHFYGDKKPNEASCKTKNGLLPMYGCCRGNGKKAGRSPKGGCSPCVDISQRLCKMFTSAKRGSTAEEQKAFF